MSFLKTLPDYIAGHLKEFTMLEVEGIENIPSRGPALIVPNHSGVFGWDAVILNHEIYEKRRRIPRTMTHPFWEHSPLMKDVASRFGLFKRDLRHALRLLKHNNLILIFPEAERGNFKPSIKMYQLVDFETGFVALAAMSGAPVIPVAIIGGEENYINLSTLDIFEKSLGFKIPLPLNLLPFRSKWKIKILKPISFKKYGKKAIKNEKFLYEASQNIRFRIQATIHKELVRKGIFKF